jgi:hypothetical protein
MKDTEIQITRDGPWTPVSQLTTSEVVAVLDYLKRGGSVNLEDTDLPSVRDRLEIELEARAQEGRL